MNPTALRAAAAILAALALPASAKTYYVDAATGSDANTGLSAAAAFRTIQQAIDRAAAGSTILVAPGTYAPIKTNNKKLAIMATEGAEETVIDGEGAPGAIGAALGRWMTPALVAPYYRATAYRNVETGERTVVETIDVDSDAGLSGAILPKGWWGIVSCEVRVPEGWWGFVPDATRMPDPNLPAGTIFKSRPPDEYFNADDWDDRWERVSDKKVRGRIACGEYRFHVGGSATALTGFTITGCHRALQSGTATHCIVSGNAYGDDWRNPDHAENGASTVYKALLSDCLVADNTATNILEETSITRCVVSRNAVALLSWDSVMTGDGVARCSLFTENQGYYLLFGCTAVYNSTIVSNTIGWNPYNNEIGAAVFCCDVYDSIIWGNRAPEDGPANIWLVDDGITGTLVAGCYMNYWEEELIFLWPWEASWTMMNSLVEDFLVLQTGNKGKRSKNSTGNLTGDPLFIDPANGDYHLAPNSPCANAGADYTKKTGKFDLDGAARKVGKVDMGAYELQPRTAVPADYDGDGRTDAAFYFATSGQWWIFQSRDGLRTISLPDRNGVPCPADYDGDGAAEPAYFTATASTPEFVRLLSNGSFVRTPFGTKGATPVAARFSAGGPATFGVYTANAKKPAFSFLGNPFAVTFGAKASRPVVADFDGDGTDDLGVYAATASKPAFSILQSTKGYSTANLFQGGPVALGAKGAIPCCADFDNDGKADFATFLSNAKTPYFTRLPSTTMYRETRTLPMGRKGDAPVVGAYEAAYGPANLAVWTGTKWTYIDSSYAGIDLDLLGE